ncbi:MGMT family protein [Aestuariimicrobium kwangyangense]|uniref:MGMT family protein n=1 Tax=Aestuariimicrobium kwangyangense TaxID=396389 RepID=UPI00248096FE|nr:MGMT family protein [Aestuariimicrobium kwangyangense]
MLRHTRIDSPIGELTIADDGDEATSVAAVAAELGDRRQAQRVRHAVGRNPIGIPIPCHRVIGADCSLTGFAGGIDRKVFLLELEEPADVAAARSSEGP